MQRAVMVWAGAGALVVVLWNLLISAVAPSASGAMWMLVDITCPIALARHHALSFPVVLLANAATYALAGLLVAWGQQRFHRSRTALGQ